MAGYFEIKGIEELQEDINALMKKYPSETEAELEKIATDFQKDVNKKFPHKGTTGNRKSVAKKWKKWRLTDGITGMTMGVSLQNQAPHFHLVENGHRQVINAERYAALKSGKTSVFSGQKRQRKSSKASNLVEVGFVQGKHYCEKTRNEWNNGEFAERVEKHVDKLLKKHNL